MGVEGGGEGKQLAMIVCVTYFSATCAFIECGRAANGVISRRRLTSETRHDDKRPPRPPSFEHSVTPFPWNRSI